VVTVDVGLELRGQRPAEVMGLIDPCSQTRRRALEHRDHAGADGDDVPHAVAIAVFHQQVPRAAIGQGMRARWREAASGLGGADDQRVRLGRRHHQVGSSVSVGIGDHRQLDAVDEGH